MLVVGQRLCGDAPPELVPPLLDPELLPDPEPLLDPELLPDPDPLLDPEPLPDPLPDPEPLLDPELLPLLDPDVLPEGIAPPELEPLLLPLEPKPPLLDPEPATPPELEPLLEPDPLDVAALIPGSSTSEPAAQAPKENAATTASALIKAVRMRRNVAPRSCPKHSIGRRDARKTRPRMDDLSAHGFPARQGRGGRFDQDKGGLYRSASRRGQPSRSSPPRPGDT